MEKIGQVAYKLSLPDSTSIHPVFHVSLLKKAVGNLTQVSDTLPVQTDALQFPAKVLDRRVQTKDHVTVSQVLVQWSSWPPSLATWEDEAALRAKFPVAPAWGQAVSKEEGDVRVAPSTTKANRAANRPRRTIKPNPQVFGPDWQS